LNLYLYARGSPIVMVDPNGMKEEEWSIGGLVERGIQALPGGGSSGEGPSDISGEAPPPEEPVPINPHELPTDAQGFYQYPDVEPEPPVDPGTASTAAGGGNEGERVQTQATTEDFVPGMTLPQMAGMAPPLLLLGGAGLSAVGAAGPGAGIAASAGRYGTAILGFLNTLAPKAGQLANEIAQGVPQPEFAGVPSGAGNVLRQAAKSTAGGGGGAGHRIALGLSHSSSHSEGLLSRFAEKVDALTYLRWQDVGLGKWNNRTFEEYFLESAKNAESIHFNLSGMDMSRAAKATSEGFKKTGEVTGAELMAIIADPKLLKKTTFYRDGEVVASKRVMKELGR
jgi:hypothetical protein